MSQSQRSLPNSRGAFVEPTTLGDLNARLVDFGLPGRLTAPEYRLLLERHPKSDIVRALISLHNGGPHANNAATFLSRILGQVHEAVRLGGEPKSDGKTFTEPKSLGDLNALITRHNLGRALNKSEFDILVQTMGRSDLVDALRAVHGGGSESEHLAGVVRHQVETAIVRVARGETASQQRRPEDDLPPDTGGDTGYAGTANSRSRLGAASTSAKGPERSFQERANQRAPQAAQQRSSPAPARSGDSGQAFPERPQARAYGKRAALCVEATDDGTQGPTLMVEMAPSIGEKTYDWKNGKIRFQLMRKELLEVLAVLYGFADGAEFKNHGETKVKALTLQNQEGGRLYMKLVDKDTPMLVLPITEKDTLAAFAGLALAQTLKAFPGFSAGDLLLFVRQRVAPHIAPVAARAAAPASR